jgi:hypothetical protein
MKRLMAILFAIVAAGALMQAAFAYGISGSAGMVGTDGFGFFATASGTKNGEDKLAEALGQLQAWKAAKEQEKKQSSAGLAFSGSALSNSTADNASLFNKAAENSTLNNVRTDSIRMNINNINNINNTNSTNSTNSTNGSSANSFPLNTPISQAAAGNDVDRKADEANASILAGKQNIGSGSKERFSGYYGMTASRHEIGKSDINSHMFLSGNFEMDKTVKFQDQGMD